jgi:hypothetical protein
MKITAISTLAPPAGYDRLVEIELLDWSARIAPIGARDWYARTFDPVKIRVKRVRTIERGSPSGRRFIGYEGKYLVELWVAGGVVPTTGSF